MGISLALTYPDPEVYNEVKREGQGRGSREGMAEERADEERTGETRTALILQRTLGG